MSAKRNRGAVVQRYGGAVMWTESRLARLARLALCTGRVGRYETTYRGPEDALTMTRRVSHRARLRSRQSTADSLSFWCSLCGVARVWVWGLARVWSEVVVRVAKSCRVAAAHIARRRVA
jgi:hypothetical protein